MIRLPYVIRAFRIVGYALAVYGGYYVALLYARGLRRGVLPGKAGYLWHILAVGHKYDHGQHHCQKYIHKRAGQHHYHALPYRLGVEALGIGYTFILTVEGAQAAYGQRPDREAGTVFLLAAHHRAHSYGELVYSEAKLFARVKMPKFVYEYQHRKHQQRANN